MLRRVDPTAGTSIARLNPVGPKSPTTCVSSNVRPLPISLLISSSSCLLLPLLPFAWRRTSCALQLLPRPPGCVLHLQQPNASKLQTVYRIPACWFSLQSRKLCAPVVFLSSLLYLRSLQHANHCRLVCIIQLFRATLICHSHKTRLIQQLIERRDIRDLWI